MRVYKYAARPGVFELCLSDPAKPLSVGQQDDSVVMWVLVDPDKPAIWRRFYAAMTGAELPEGIGNFIATVQRTDGIVVHLFEMP